MNTDARPTSLSSQMGGGYTPESWEYSRAFVTSLGRVPTTFTSVIRLLISDHDKDPNSLTEFGSFFVSRLLNAPSIKAVYFNALRDVRPYKVGTRATPFPASNFVKSFSGYEHAVLLSLLYTYRVCKKNAPDAQAFDLVNARLGRSVSIGWYIGEAIPAIGPSNGVLAASFRVLGLLPFVKHEPDRFREYWQYLGEQGLATDIDYEFRMWQCNALQIAALLGQQMGLGLDRAVPLMKALTTYSPMLPSEELERAFRVTDIWFRTLMENRTTPTVPLPPKYYPNKPSLDRLIERYHAVLKSTEPHWLFSTREDLSPEKTPQLYIGDPPAMSVNEAAGAEIEEVPEEMRESLSTETISELSNKLLTYVMTSDEE